MVTRAVGGNKKRMRVSTYISLFILISSCHINRKGQVKNDSFDNEGNIEYAIVEFRDPTHFTETKRDTFLVGCETLDCFIIWNKDTITKAERFEGPI